MCGSRLPELSTSSNAHFTFPLLVAQSTCSPSHYRHSGKPFSLSPPSLLRNLVCVSVPAEEWVHFPRFDCRVSGSSKAKQKKIEESPEKLSLLVSLDDLWKKWRTELNKQIMVVEIEWVLCLWSDDPLLLHTYWPISLKAIPRFEGSALRRRTQNLFLWWRRPRIPYFSFFSPLASGKTNDGCKQLVDFGFDVILSGAKLQILFFNIFSSFTSI